MEAFSGLIQQFQFHTEVYHNARLCGNWKLEQQQTGKTCFHLVTGSRCHLSIPDYGEAILGFRDLILFPKSYTILWHSRTRRQPERLKTPAYYVPKLISVLGVEMLLQSLPEVLILKNSETRCWLEPLLQLIVSENAVRKSGSSAILDRLSELIFIYSLRHFLDHHPARVSVLALYADTRLSAAINAIHTDPAENWTIGSLAQVCAMSRTSFANHFKSVSGWTVMQYLTWWRMQIALGQLRQGKSVSTVSYQVGYQSESAFSRVFVKHFGFNPGKTNRQS